MPDEPEHPPSYDDEELLNEIYLAIDEARADLETPNEGCGTFPVGRYLIAQRPEGPTK